MVVRQLVGSLVAVGLLSAGVADTVVPKGKVLKGERLSGKVVVRGGALVDCIVERGSVVFERGGAMTNCVVTGCSGNGAAVSGDSRETAEAVGCTLVSNTTSSVLGTGYVNGSRLRAIGCRVADNACWSCVVGPNVRGGPLSDVSCDGCTIVGNRSKWGSIVGGQGTYRKCRIADNLVENRGAAVSSPTNGSGIVLVECTVTGNRTHGKSGGGTGGNIVAVGTTVRGNVSGTLDAVDTLVAATNCTLAIGALVGGDVRGGVSCTRGSVPRRPWRLNSDGTFPLVRDGVLVARLVGEDGPAFRLAESEYRRLMKKITGCDVDAVAYAAADGIIELHVDPSLGSGDVYSAEQSNNPNGRTVLLLKGSNARSTWFALVEVLERLGCRWFWPGDDGEYLPRPTKDLAVPRFAVKRTAAFPMRDLSPHPDPRKEMFLAHNRFNSFRKTLDWGQTRSLGGHSFVGVYPPDCKNMRECRDKYPEMMAQWQNGRRRPDQHCYTNPKTVDLFVDWICRFWQEHPDCELLGLSPVDTPVHCLCPDCKKHGDSSTLYFDFLATIVNAANARCPGRRYRSCAYSFYWDVPKNPIPANVMLDYCMYDRCYMHALRDPSCERNRTLVRKMASWKKHLGGVAPAIYGYHFDWGGEPWFVPQNRVLQDELKWARDFGVTYWHTEWMCGWAEKKSAHEAVPREKEKIFAYRLSAYCLGRLLWNPDADLSKIEGDWCRRVYGAAGREMLDYFTTMETAWMKGTKHPSWYGIKPYDYIDGFLTPEVVKACDALFAAAERKLAATDDVRARGEVALEKAFWLKWRNFAVRQQFAGRLTAMPDEKRLGQMKTMSPGRTLYPREGESDPTSFDWRKAEKKAFWPKGAWTCPSREWINLEVSFEVLFDGPRPEKDGLKDYNTYLSDALTLRLRDGGVRYGTAFDCVEFSFSPDCCGPFKRVAYDRPLDRTSWHTVRVRTADAKFFVWIDGKPVYEGSAAIGGGRIDFATSRPSVRIRNLKVSDLLPLPGADAPQAKAVGPVKLDGTGRPLAD